MNLVVVGLGAIGGVVAGRLHDAGHDVVGVARGAHLAAIRRDGLLLATPGGTRRVPLPVVGAAADAAAASADAVLVAVKSQDTARVVADLVGAGVAPTVPVVSLQNGIDNERTLLRTFRAVHGVCVMCPATHVEPGVVMAHSEPVTGILDIGRYPTGVDRTTDSVADAFAAAGFLALARPDIMRWKATKLLMNLANAVEALCGPAARFGALARRARAEGIACLEAAGIDRASDEEDRARRADHLGLAATEAGSWRGGSTWQSLARHGTTEVDYLNGEISLLGRLHGIPTPVNDMLVESVHRAERARAAPGSMTEDELLDALADGR